MVARSRRTSATRAATVVPAIARASIASRSIGSWSLIFSSPFRRATSSFHVSSRDGGYLLRHRFHPSRSNTFSPEHVPQVAKSRSTPQPPHSGQIEDVRGKSGRVGYSSRKGSSGLSGGMPESSTRVSSLRRTSSPAVDDRRRLLFGVPAAVDMREVYVAAKRVVDLTDAGLAPFRDLVDGHTGTPGEIHGVADGG